MTPLEIITASKAQMNATNDTLWSDTELYTQIKMRADEMNMEARCTTATTYANSVAGTAEYSEPADLMELKELRYNGKKLQDLTGREKDTIVLDSTVSLSGTPTWYEPFGSTVTLYSTPDTSVTNGLRWRYYATEDVPTAASTLKTPARYHWGLVVGLNFSMCPKDLGHPLTVYWKGQWDEAKRAVVAHVRKARRGDRPGNVTAEEDTLSTDFGTI